MRGFKAGRFSFNVAGGRCEECKGAGIKVIEMNFLPSVHVPCEACGGKRYKEDTLAVRYKGKNIAEVLEMDFAEEIIPLFTAIGMHCLGCAAASQETVEEACMVHGIDPDAFVSAVNGVIEGLAAQKAQ